MGRDYTLLLSESQVQRNIQPSVHFVEGFAIENILKAANFQVLILVPQLPPYSLISKRSTELLPPQPHLSVLHYPFPPGGSQDIPAVQIQNLQGSSLRHLLSKAVCCLIGQYYSWPPDGRSGILMNAMLSYCVSWTRLKKKSLSNFNSTLHVFNSMMPIIPVYSSLQCY